MDEELLPYEGHEIWMSCRMRTDNIAQHARDTYQFRADLNLSTEGLARQQTVRIYVKVKTDDHIDVFCKPARSVLPQCPELKQYNVLR